MLTSSSHTALHLIPIYGMRFISQRQTANFGIIIPIVPIVNIVSILYTHTHKSYIQCELPRIVFWKCNFIRTFTIKLYKTKCISSVFFVGFHTNDFTTTDYSNAINSSCSHSSHGLRNKHDFIWCEWMGCVATLSSVWYIRMIRQLDMLSDMFFCVAFQLHRLESVYCCCWNVKRA